MEILTRARAVAGQLGLISGVTYFSGSAVPTNATTGAGFAEKGSLYFRTANGAVYANTGTKASPTWTQFGTVAALANGKIFIGGAGGAAAEQTPSGDATISNTGVVTIGAKKILETMLADAVMRIDEVLIPAADIIAVGAGKFGHADGFPLVVGPGAGKVLEFLGATVIYDQGVKAYTAGGDTTVNFAGGAVLSNLVAAANFCAHNGDTVYQLRPLVGAAGISMLVNTGINLVTTVAFTDAGVGAVGVVRVQVAYRVHTTGL
jgi:hypothetical protein